MSGLDPIRGGLGDGPLGATRARQRAALLARRRTVRARWLWVPAVVVVAWSVVMLREPSPQPLEPGWLAPQTAFPEGSVVRMAPGSALHLDDWSEERADLTLTHGDFDAEIAKNTGRTWRMHAGRFTIRVVGTGFHVHYEPDQHFEVRVTEGVVEVTSPDGASELLHAGQSFHRSLAAPPSAPPPTPVEVPAPKPVPRVAPVKKPTVEAAPVPPPASVPDEVPPDWHALLGEGHRAEALEVARAFIDGPLTDDELLRLADAARLERDDALARSLLSRVSERGGAASAEAAFLLGRLNADVHALREARAAFERSIVLSAQGPFSEQARGRLMEVLLELQDLPAARAAAHAYLQFHPAGAWSSLAQRVVKQAAP